MIFHSKDFQFCMIVGFWNVEASKSKKAGFKKSGAAKFIGEKVISHYGTISQLLIESTFQMTHLDCACILRVLQCDDQCKCDPRIPESNYSAGLISFYI